MSKEYRSLVHTSAELLINEDIKRRKLITEASKKGNYHSVFYNHEGNWRHHGDYDTRSDADEERGSLRNQGEKTVRLTVPNHLAHWNKMDAKQIHQYVTDRIKEKSGIDENFDIDPDTEVIEEGLGKKILGTAVAIGVGVGATNVGTNAIQKKKLEKTAMKWKEEAKPKKMAMKEDMTDKLADQAVKAMHDGKSYNSKKAIEALRAKRKADGDDTKSKITLKK